MGGAVSYAAAAAVKPSQTEGKEEKHSKDVDSVDWLNLPCPVKYEEIQRENIMSLKPELFEGLRFDFTKPLNQRFSLSHSLFMGSVEVPSQGAQIIKVPAAHYEFGANLIDQRMTMLIGRILTDGRMSARVKYDVTDRFSIKVNAQITNEPHFSQGMFHFDYRVGDFDLLSVLLGAI
jgi:mitochondrial import receptor subunit TOM40